MDKKVNIIFFVETYDNTKETICAIPSDIDMRKENVIDFIGNCIKETLEGVNHLFGEHAKELATALAHHDYASMFGYEFGIEHDVPCLEC
jgi:hypothetical protein